MPEQTYGEVKNPSVWFEDNAAKLTFCHHWAIKAIQHLSDVFFSQMITIEMN